MPSTVNSVGTAYVGQSNTHRHQGVCDHCGAFTTLSSYDTRLFFVVLYKLPVFPLAAKKVIGECRACSRHHAMGLKKWEREGRAAVDGAIERAEANPNDPEAAREALGLTVAFHRPVEFDALAPAAEEAHPKAWPVRQAVAEGHAFFGHQEEAARAAAEAQRVADEPEQRRDSRRTRVAALARAGRLDEALTEAGPLRDAPEEGDTFALLVLAETLAARGRSAEGLRFLDAIAAGHPAFASEKVFTKLRRKFEKAAESGRELKPELLAAGPVQAEGGRTWLPWVAVLGLPLIAAIAFTLASFNAAGARQVVVVGGADPGSTVEVDGQRINLFPGLSVPIELPEGQHAVTVVTADGRRIDRGTFEVEGTFFGRLFDGDTRVLNADGAALIVDASVSYGALRADRPDALLDTGLYQVVEGVDYAFEEPPSTIELDSSSKGALRRHLGLVSLPANEAVLTVLAEQGAEAAGRYALDRFVLEPDDPTLAGLVSALSEPAALDAALRPLLDERPVRVNAHRVRQEATRGAEALAEVQARYAALSDAEPTDPDLLYLAARIDPDPATSRAWLLRAVEQAPDHPWANLALAHLELLGGRLEPAARRATAAEAVEGGSLLASIDWIRQNHAALREQLPADPAGLSSLEAAIEVVTLERLLDGAAAAEQAADAATAGFGLDDAEQEEAVRGVMLGHAAYAAGDAGPLLAALEDEDGERNFRRIALAGDAEAAAEAIATLHREDDPAADAAYLAVVAASAGNGLPEPTFDLVAAAAAGDAWSERMAAWAGGEGDAFPLPITAWRPDLAVYLLLRAETDTANRPALLDLAETLNGDLREPHLLQAAAIERLRR